ncbi:hypothetical protein [Streptomyces zagrosensis]|uniref:Uncharacterized protein n=1 Tax=Streptomyces zagrosensis TaxID=1042984 RepID=A0A7W9QCB6_9ACTN|nr:hypothetical protein [Streptomyces zagrosensis]MBB5937645.1 hypothetical protein [Streptomyces zagrosensis]
MSAARIEQLLAAVPTGATDTDPVVRAELEADAAATAAREADLGGAARIGTRRRAPSAARARRPGADRPRAGTKRSVTS